MEPDAADTGEPGKPVREPDAAETGKPQKPTKESEIPEPEAVLTGEPELTLPEGFHAAEEAIVLEDVRMLANWPEGRLWRVKISGEPKKSCQVSWIISRASPSC